MAVAGQFYPDDPQELRTQLKEFFRAYPSDPDGRIVRALIVPHAGYVFSGEVAASAYACLPASARYERVFLIGPSHRASFEGASVDTGFNACETPLGRVRIDSACARNLVKQDSVFSYVPAAHLQEHCLEYRCLFCRNVSRKCRLFPSLSEPSGFPHSGRSRKPSGRTGTSGICS